MEWKEEGEKAEKQLICDSYEVLSVEEQLENIEKIVQIKNTLDLLGIKVNTRNIRELTELNPKDIEKVAQMKSNLDLLEIKVDARDIRRLAESNPKDIEKVIQMKENLDILGVRVHS